MLDKYILKPFSNLVNTNITTTKAVIYKFHKKQNKKICILIDR